MAARILSLLVRLYQLTLGTVLPPSCRFQPTCSNHAIEALRRHGALTGSWLTLRRVLRCHPFSPGGYDPVPDPPRKLTTVAHGDQ